MPRLRSESGVGGRSAREPHAQPARMPASMGGGARNKPCPCGSGRKYKKCCLPREDQIAARRRRAERIVIADRLTLMFQELIERDADRYDAARRQADEELNAEFVASLGEGLDGREAAEALEQELSRIEDRMRSILQRRPGELWFIVSRRLPPIPIDDASGWTFLLYRRILTLAILKHGDRTRQAAMEETKHPAGSSFFPAEATDEVLTEIGSIDVLAWKYAMVAAAIRRVGKGAVLRSDEDGRFDTPATEEIERLIASLDNRVEEFGTLGGSHGAEADVEIDEGDLDSPLALVGIRPNLRREDTHPLHELIGVGLLHQTPFVPDVLSIEDVKATIFAFSDAFHDAFGVGPSVAVGTLWALSAEVGHMLTAGSPFEARQPLVTGYRVVAATGDEQFASRLASVYRGWQEHVEGRRLTPEEARSESDDGVAALTYSDADLDAISLWDRLPFRCVIRFGARRYLDYTAVPLVLSDFFRSVGSVVGDKANLKGERYEAEVNRRGENAGLRAWLSGRKLRAEDGQEREIDASFIVDGTLWVLECKAFAQDVRVDRGDFAKLNGRTETLRQYLDQARTLADFLRQHPHGRNYDVPDGLGIDYCVITSGIEWIWSEASELWLSDEVPRICTFDEWLSVVASPA